MKIRVRLRSRRTRRWLRWASRSAHPRCQLINHLATIHLVEWNKHEIPVGKFSRPVRDRADYNRETLLQLLVPYHRRRTSRLIVAVLKIASRLVLIFFFLSLSDFLLPLSILRRFMFAGNRRMFLKIPNCHHRCKKQTKYTCDRSIVHSNLLIPYFGTFDNNRYYTLSQ